MKTETPDPPVVKAEPPGLPVIKTERPEWPGFGFDAETPHAPVVVPKTEAPASGVPIVKTETPDDHPNRAVVPLVEPSVHVPRPGFNQPQRSRQELEAPASASTGNVNSHAPAHGSSTYRSGRGEITRHSRRAPNPHVTVSGALPRHSTPRDRVHSYPVASFGDNPFNIHRGGNLHIHCYGARISCDDYFSFGHQSGYASSSSLSCDPEGIQIFGGDFTGNWSNRNLCEVLHQAIDALPGTATPSSIYHGNFPVYLPTVGQNSGRAHAATHIYGGNFVIDVAPNGLLEPPVRQTGSLQIYGGDFEIYLPTGRIGSMPPPDPEDVIQIYGGNFDVYHASEL